MKKSQMLASAVAVVTLSATATHAQTDISWWHAMTGANSEVVEKIASDFNASQSDFRVMPVFKGTYPETLNAGIAAFRAGQSPDIIQVFDVGTGVMIGAEGAVMPVADVLTNAGMTFDKSAYLPGIVAYYSKPDGTMLSFPYNSSSPITYYNKDIFEAAGLDPDVPPQTWDDVWSMSKTIQESGAAPCGYTSTWLTWIHLENFAAWNDVSYATQSNGLEPGSTPELQINAPIFVDHFQQIADLASNGTFKYGGRTAEAKQIFLASECGILTESSGGLGDIVNSGINYGIGQLPYAADGNGPQNTIPGGASLWVMGGKSDETYNGVAAFFSYLSQGDVQEYLHQTSGYLPVTMEAYEATNASGFYGENPGRETPITQMMGKEPTENSKGVRLPNLPQIRDIQNEEFERMLAGDQTAQQALDNAVERGNAAIVEAMGQ